MALVSGRGNDYAFTMPAPWVEIFQFDHSNVSGPNTLAMFKRYAPSSPSADSASWTGGVVNGTVISISAAFRSTGSPIIFDKLGLESSNNPSQDIGPISSISDLEKYSLLIVCGHIADDFGSVPLLSGDGETWVDLGAVPILGGDDAGQVWQFALLANDPPSITSKTFEPVAGSSAYGIGIMVSFEITDGNINPGEGKGGNFARVIT